MKKIKLAFVIILFIFIIALFSVIKLTSNYHINDIDTVAVNEIQKECLNNFDNLNSLKKNKFKYDFLILDNNDKVLYTQGSHSYTSIESAMKKHNTYVNLFKENESIGKVIIFTNIDSEIETLKNNIFKVIIFSFSIILFLIISVLYYINKTILNPFKKLEHFAYNIASGNLDAPLEMDKNNIFGAFTESFDIMREELNNAKQKEYLANKSKKELVAALSHDIKTPLTSIKLISELLLVMVEEEKIKGKISSIHKKADIIDHLVTDMFNSTLTELNELKVTVKDEYSTSLKELFLNADYSNKIKLAPIPPCVIKIDLFRFQQILNNIINNSYKYADTEIDVDFSIDSAYFQINIKDYGTGVSKDDIPLLFNKFYRGQNALSKKQNGSGLGLYICKYLINKMNGDISCCNEEDGFKIEILVELSHQ